MQVASRAVQVVFEPIDLLPELIPITPIAIPVTIRPFVLPPQPLDLTTLSFNLALLPFEFLDQLLARRRGPARLHAGVMARLTVVYKSKEDDCGCGRRSASAVTR